MDATVQGIEKGGHVLLDLSNNLCGSGQGGTGIWAGDMSDENAHWEGVGRILPQGGL